MGLRYKKRKVSIMRAKVCIWDAHTININSDARLLDAIGTHATYNPAPLFIISKDDRISGLTKAVSIPEGTIQINTSAFWKGRHKNTISTTNTTDLFVHMSPSFTQQDANTVDLITRIHNTLKYDRKTTDAMHAIFTEAMHETPPTIHALGPAMMYPYGLFALAS
jgi:hypothetical protein